jgi:ankyrin repeat protein
MTISYKRICLGVLSRRVFVSGAVLLILTGCGRGPDSVTTRKEEVPSSKEGGPPGKEMSASKAAPASNGPNARREPAAAARKVSIDDSAFRTAALEGRIETVRQAIAGGVDVGATDEGGRTALLLASFNGHTPIVKLLLDHGALLGHRDATGRTALMYAATGANEATVRLLLEAGAKPNVTDRGERFTALMHAAAEGQAQVVQALLEHNADPTLRDVDGDTARDFAARNGHAEVVRLLPK